VGDNIVALAAIAATQPLTSMKVGLQPKKRPVLKEKCLPPPITLPGYTWVDAEVGTYFFRYIYESDLLNLLSWLSISAIMKLEYCLVTLCTIRSDATPHLEFVYMNREGMNMDLFYMYDCLFHNLHLRIPFDDF